MGEDIKEAKDYPLSDQDIRNLLGDDIKILTYPDLGKMRSIDEAFDGKGRSIILFLTNGPTEGHWCCMLNKKKGIEFFDPYGDAPEEQKEGIPKSRLEMLDQDRPFLTKLLRASGKPVFYNNHAFQRESKNINTCGRWCVGRMMYAPKSLEFFKKVVDDSGMSPDNFITALTANFLGK